MSLYDRLIPAEALRWGRLTHPKLTLADVLIHIDGAPAEPCRHPGSWGGVCVRFPGCDLPHCRWVDGPFADANKDAIQAEIDYAEEHYGPEDFR